jgi:hypothetical protein
MPTGKIKMGSRPPGRREKKMDFSTMWPTVPLQAILVTEVENDPFTTFVKFPIKEIRQACLKRIEEVQDIYSYHADWAEECINRLREIHDQYDYWKKLIEWYLFAAEDEPILKRAIEFVLTLSQKEGGLISKLLAGRLKKGSFDTDIYYRVPSLRNFFHGLLRNFYWQEWWWKGKTRSGEYREQTWHGVTRTLDVAVLVGDFSLIDKINDIIVLMEKGVIFPDRFAHWAAKDMRIAYLKTAKECLERAKSEASEEEED